MGRLGKQLLRGLREISEMYGYKKEKLPWYKAAWEAFYFSKLHDIITEPYNIVRRFVNKCIKIAQFLPLVWRHEDWDSAYTLEFMHFLFKRMYAAVYINGHHVEKPSHKKRLLIATELLRRMANRDDIYMEGHRQYMEKKFGETNYDFVTVNDPETGRKYTSMKDMREDNLSESDLKLYKKMKSYLYGEHENKMFKQDMELFCKILKKDCRHWWD